MNIQIQSQDKKIESDPHVVLSSAFRGATINGNPAAIVTYQNSCKIFHSQIKKLFCVFIQNIFIIKYIRKSAKCHPNNSFIVREFSNLSMLFLSLGIYKIKRNVLFNINHNIKNIFKKFPFSIYLMARLGYNFLLLDGFKLHDYIPFKIRPRFHFFPFPIPIKPFDFSVTVTPGEFRVGIVGDFRSEKASLDDVNTLISKFMLFGDCQLKIGVRSVKLLEKFSLPETVIIYDTSDLAGYHKFLKNIDFIIIMARRDSYFSRHSGTLMDAVSNGVIPVVPHYPVFTSQISCPVQVGVTYNSFNDIPNALLFAKLNYCFLKSNFINYLAHRSRALSISTAK